MCVMGICVMDMDLVGGWRGSESEGEEGMWNEMRFDLGVSSTQQRPLSSDKAGP